jgi:hypothetical protein
MQGFHFWHIFWFNFYIVLKLDIFQGQSKGILAVPCHLAVLSKTMECTTTGKPEVFKKIYIKNHAYGLKICNTKAHCLWT